MLRGHCAGVYAIAGAHTSAEVCSVGMDNNMIIWNPVRGTKQSVIPLNSFYTLALSYSPSDAAIAFGGLDCSVYVSSLGKISQLHTHGAYVTDLQFLSETNLLSASADKTVQVYDLGQNTVVHTFNQHFQDVLSVDVQSAHVFCTGSADGFARLFDTRTGRQVQIFSLQHQACQCVKFHPNGQEVACSCGTGVQMFDLRSEHLIQGFQGTDMNNMQQKLCFSKSGRLLFSTCGQNINCYDVLYGTYLGDAGAHETQVTGLCLGWQGEFLISGGWDTVLRVWG